MSGAVAFEGEINSIVKEYLSYNGFEKAVHSFEVECAEKGTPVASLEVRPKTGRRLANIQQQMMQHFENGCGPEFFELWMTHLPQDLRDNDIMAPRLEFLLNVYFTIYPFRIGIEDREKYTAKFRQYLETRGNHLSRTPEFVSYCALAFIKDPRQVPSFSELFSDSWTEALRKRLTNFLSSSLRARPQPRLVQLLHSNGRSRDVEQLELRVKESEKTTTLYRKRCTKVQNDYYNLIEITANLVDTLEQCIEGKPVALDYIPQICNRLFANDVRQTMDFSRPGTAGKTLRETVPSQPVRTQSNKDMNLNSSLDFNKIKSDLVTAGERKKALLLQALRWKLTRASYSERMTMISAYRTNDLIGCTTRGPIKQAVLDMVSGESNVLKQSLARLLNTIASSWEVSQCTRHQPMAHQNQAVTRSTSRRSVCRGYLALSSDLVMELIKGLQRSAHDSVSQEHILACLQKLSLRSNLRPMMINEGLISWLVTGLKSYDTISDYMLEYSIALLMNLTIQSYGRNRCVPLGSQLLKIISNLLGHENVNIRPFVHGTLYSLLHVPSISEEAREMGMEEILTTSVKDEDDEEKKHVLFLIKRLNTFSEEPDLSNDSDDDDDDDVYEEDQEELEKDLDNDDVVRQQAGELSGNQFLAKYYAISDVSGHQRHRLFDNVLATDDILRRPKTPSYIRSNTDRLSNIGDSTAVRASYLSAPPGPRSQRPPTRSGSRPSSRDEVLPKSAPRQQQVERQPTGGADHPFVSRPKIMRTPEPSSGRPGSRGHELMSPLQPKFSDSLPRPGSGGRSSSQSSLQLK